jgi:hypothetical protein
MDFTYYLAGVIALVLGAIVSAAALMLKSWGAARVLAAAFAISVAVNLTSLLDWSQLGAIGLSWLTADIALIVLYSLIGSMVGAVPMLAARNVWRRWRGGKSG